MEQNICSYCKWDKWELSKECWPKVRIKYSKENTKSCSCQKILAAWSFRLSWAHIPLLLNWIHFLHAVFPKWTYYCPDIFACLGLNFNLSFIYKAFTLWSPVALFEGIWTCLTVTDPSGLLELQSKTLYSSHCSIMSYMDNTAKFCSQLKMCVPWLMTQFLQPLCLPVWPPGSTS